MNKNDFVTMNITRNQAAKAVQSTSTNKMSDRELKLLEINYMWSCAAQFWYSLPEKEEEGYDKTIDDELTPVYMEMGDFWCNDEARINKNHHTVSKVYCKYVAPSKLTNEEITEARNLWNEKRYEEFNKYIVDVILPVKYGSLSNAASSLQARIGRLQKKYRCWNLPASDGYNVIQDYDCKMVPFLVNVVNVDYGTNITEEFLKNSRFVLFDPMFF